ncbi:MAG: protein kinase domain-containing protein [Thermodesulfobacteriota bacterium]
MKIGNYHILEKLNSGGMATVYKGLQESLDRPVAIKVLHKQFAGDSHLVARFKRESLIIARLTHPNIIHVIDRGLTETGMPYFVMDFVNGADVTGMIQERTGTLNQKIDLLIQVCKAISYAHKNGVIHRDIKPANILVDTEGNVLVTDFGIAQFFDDAGEEDRLSREQVVMGTPAYMSPEQKTGAQAITAASDLYSLGVVMYELFTGSKPPENHRVVADIDRNFPPVLSRLIMSCLEPDPAKRPLSADMVRDRLLELLQGAHIRDTQKREAMRGVTKMEDTFTLLDVIKEHPYGAVFLLRHKFQDRLMVVKRFNAPLGGFKEAQLLTTLKHENIVNIYGVSGAESNSVIVMEYLSGGSLSDRLVKTYEWVEALKIIKPVCQGLAFAHRNRIIHGNLRPSNILFSSTGVVKLTDFGLKEHYLREADNTNWYNTVKQTRSSQADLFAAGAILHQLLTGSIPEVKESGIVAHPSFKQLPREVRHLVIRMLIRDPALGFQQADQITAAIDALLDSRSQDPTLVFEGQGTPTADEKRSRWLSAWKIALFLLPAMAVGAYMLIRGGHPELLAEIHRIWVRISALWAP